MREPLVVEVSGIERILIWPMFAGLIPACVVMTQISNPFLQLILVLMAYVVSCALIYLLIDNFATVDISNDDVEARFTITAQGILAELSEGPILDLGWSDIFCIEKLADLQGTYLQIWTKKLMPRKIIYYEAYLSVPCDDIMAYVYNVCPYGKDISFWNERRL